MKCKCGKELTIDNYVDTLCISCGRENTLSEYMKEGEWVRLKEENKRLSIEVTRLAGIQVSVEFALDLQEGEIPKGLVDEYDRYLYDYVKGLRETLRKIADYGCTDCNYSTPCLTCLKCAEYKTSREKYCNSCLARVVLK